MNIKLIYKLTNQTEEYNFKLTPEDYFENDDLSITEFDIDDVPRFQHAIDYINYQGMVDIKKIFFTKITIENKRNNIDVGEFFWANGSGRLIWINRIINGKKLRKL